MAEAEPPSWLDKHFIETSLRATSNDPRLTVASITISPAVGAGENFASLLHRVVATTADDETHHLVVKSLPQDGVIRQIVTVCRTFEVERRIYETTLPSLVEILSERYDSVRPWFPMLYSTSRAYTLVMSDLKEEGFKMAARHEGLDFEHAVHVLKTLAQMHAASLVYYRRHPELVAEYKERFYTSERRDLMISVYGPMFTALPQQIATWPGFERFADKLRNTLTCDNLIDFMIPQAEETLVLNHGDLWLNNIMFQYDDTNNVARVKLVDFQETKYTSPAIDLQCFFASSISEVLRDKRWIELLTMYYQEFTAVLKRLDVDVTSLKDLGSFDGFQKKMDEKDLYGLLTCSTILPLALADSDSAPEFDKLQWEENQEQQDNQEDDVGFQRLYSSPRFKQVYQKLLVYYEKRGVFIN